MIRLANLADVPLLHAHLARHIPESGQDGDLIFSPSNEFERDLKKCEEEKQKIWKKSTSEIGWERCWIMIENDEIKGALNLRHYPPIPAMLHRAVLEMGLERSARGRGLGSRLLNAAIDWARNTEGLDWIDLYVFENNTPARALYQRHGFQEVGRVEDFFRVDGVSITDIQMVLKVQRI